MRTSQPAAITLLTCAVLALALSSCTTKGERSDMVLTAVVLAKFTQDPAPAPAGQGTCACPAPGALETGDVAFSTYFSPCVQLENRLPNNGDGKTRLNTNDLIIENLQVYYESTTSTPLTVPPQTIATTGFVPAGGKLTLGAFLVPATVALPTGPVRVHFYLDGRLLDGSKVRTSEYEYIAIKFPGVPSDSCNY
jgi:hypothetical protein